MLKLLFSEQLVCIKFPLILFGEEAGLKHLKLFTFNKLVLGTLNYDLPPLLGQKSANTSLIFLHIFYMLVYS